MNVSVGHCHWLVASSLQLIFFSKSAKSCQNACRMWSTLFYVKAVAIVATLQLILLAHVPTMWIMFGAWVHQQAKG